MTDPSPPTPRPKPSNLVAFPLYKQVPATFFTRWLDMDKSTLAGTITTDGVYVTTAMTHIIEIALDFDADWERLVIMEHDMVVPPDALNRISTYNDDKHIVGGLYFQHNPPYLPCVFGPKEDDWEDIAPLGPDLIKQIASIPALYKVGAVGMGFTAIHRSVFEGWDRSIPMWVKEGERSHDVWFCEQARRQGFDTFVDTHLMCEHITEGIVGYSHNQLHTDMYDELTSYHNPDSRFKSGEVHETEAHPKTYSITEILDQSKKNREKDAANAAH